MRRRAESIVRRLRREMKEADAFCSRPVGTRGPTVRSRGRRSVGRRRSAEHLTPGRWTTDASAGGPQRVARPLNVVAPSLARQIRPIFRRPRCNEIGGLKFSAEIAAAAAAATRWTMCGVAY